MTDDRSLERAARSWLEEGPARAPERTVQAALERIERTSQERDRPLPLGDLWVRLTSRAIGATAMLAVVILAGVLLLQRGPEPGPAVSPSPSQSASAALSPTATASATPLPSPSGPSDAGGPPLLTTTFTSPRNGFAISYPADWSATPATAAWPAGVVNAWGSPALDELRGATARFAGSSQPLAPGETADQWLAAYATSACITPRSSWPSVDIGSATGLIDSDGCEAPDPPIGKGGPLFDAVVVVGGRAYSFTMDGELSHSDFVSFLAAVTLDPASAVDGPTSP
jgi:hypothetical protein